MAKVPEDALNQLVRTLNSSSSPLLSREFEQEHRRESRAYGSTCTRNSNSNGSQRHTSKDSSSSRWSMPSIDIPKLGIPNIHIPNIPNIPLPSMPKFFTQGTLLHQAAAWCALTACACLVCSTWHRTVAPWELCHGCTSCCSCWRLWHLQAVPRTTVRFAHALAMFASLLPDRWCVYDLACAVCRTCLIFR